MCRRSAEVEWSSERAATARRLGASTAASSASASRCTPASKRRLAACERSPTSPARPAPAGRSRFSSRRASCLVTARDLLASTGVRSAAQSPRGDALERRHAQPRCRRRPIPRSYCTRRRETVKPDLRRRVDEVGDSREIAANSLRSDISVARPRRRGSPYHGTAPSGSVRRAERCARTASRRRRSPPCTRGRTRACASCHSRLCPQPVGRPREDQRRLAGPARVQPPPQQSSRSGASSRTMRRARLRVLSRARATPRARSAACARAPRPLKRAPLRPQARVGENGDQRRVTRTRVSPRRSPEPAARPHADAVT